MIGAGVMGRTLLRGVDGFGLIAKSQVGGRRRRRRLAERASAELGVPVEVEYEHRLKNTGMLVARSRRRRGRCSRICGRAGCLRTR